MIQQHAALYIQLILAIILLLLQVPYVLVS